MIDDLIREFEVDAILTVACSDVCIGSSYHASERLRRWTQRPRAWLYECKLYRARFTKTSVLGELRVR